MKKVFRVEFNGPEPGVEAITEQALVDALTADNCPLVFDEVNATEVKPVPKMSGLPAGKK